MENNQYLKMLREKTGLSQSETAKISGVTIRSIRAYEQGTRSIKKASVETILSLADAYGVRIDDLLRFS